jgi:transposase InsO family protein
VSLKRVERLMKEHGFMARRRRKWAKTTDSRHKFAFAFNVRERNLHATAPGEKWVSDITYLRTSSGWLYLTLILDLWDRKVIGWSMGKDLGYKQVCRALLMALGNRAPLAGFIFHSDRGVQYCSDDFCTTVKKLCPSVCQSMSRKRNCWDNALCREFF